MGGRVLLHGGERCVVAQEVPPRNVLSAKMNVCAGLYHDTAIGARLHDLVVHGKHATGADQLVLGDHQHRVGEPEPGADLVGGERVGDRDHGPSGGNRAQIGDDGFNRHRHRQRHPIPRLDSPVGETVGESCHFGL